MIKRVKDHKTKAYCYTFLCLSVLMYFVGAPSLYCDRLFTYEEGFKIQTGFYGSKEYEVIYANTRSITILTTKDEGKYSLPKAAGSLRIHTLNGTEYDIPFKNNLVIKGGKEILSKIKALGIPIKGDIELFEFHLNKVH